MRLFNRIGQLLNNLGKRHPEQREGSPDSGTEPPSGDPSRCSG